MHGVNRQESIGVFLRSNRLNKDIDLSSGKLIIGRREDCDVALTSNEVSKTHLEVRVDGGHVRIRDLNSRNNTSLNHVKIGGRGWFDLEPNDRIDLCGYDFRLITDASNLEDGSHCVFSLDDSEASFSGDASKSISLSRSEVSGGSQPTQLRALLSISSCLRDVLNTDDVLARAVETLFQILPSIDRAAIGLLDADKHFTPTAWKVRNADTDKTIRVSSTIVQHVADTSRAVATADAMQDFGEALSVQALPMRSVMTAPLLDTDDNVFGVIHVDAKRPNAFIELDLEILASIALQIGLAINVSRLHAVTLEDALLRQDIEQAKEVQRKVLPQKPPEVPGYELTGFYRPARHIGGDYIDYIELPGGRLAIVLADVVGKGVPAALTMVRLATETRASLEVCSRPAEVVTRLNQRFSDDFITLAVFILDTVANRITFCNAGQEPPLFRRAHSPVEKIGFDESGCPLGVVEHWDYTDVTLPMSCGDSIVVFSDGFPDAECQDGEQRFGADAIEEALARSDGTTDEFVQSIVKQVDQFIGGRPQFDDMAMVCLRRMP